ncbi:MAG TPA: FAD binding domain-containing protein [Polyangiaceae bacterium]|nr:FAD binding domain-containing protein [Polyangiaceae bacterium]
MAIRFVLNGSPIEVNEAPLHSTLLQWLRANGYAGTKEGCAEGECGACAVALIASDPGAAGSRFEPVNSCLLPLCAVDGREVVTVEGVARSAEQLHPVQEAMVAQGGSQCGYCTPGFVVSLFCEYYRPGRTEFDPESISGNLCRCTGYRPILDVGRNLPSPEPHDERLVQLQRSTPAMSSVRNGAGGFERPTSLTELWQAFSARPDAVVLSGGTDLLVYANQRHQRWRALVSIEAIAELQELSSTDEEIVLGAAVPLTRVERWISRNAPELRLLEELFPLFSSRLIRNRATLGGNLATASPIGDSASALLALGASVELVSRAGARRVPLAEFFTGYRRTVLQAQELIRAICIPRPVPEVQRFYKVSKRVLDDISTVAAAFALSLEADGLVRRFGAAFGGIAATPLAAPSLERLALGKPWDEATLDVLLEEAPHIGTPQDDFRGSADYRRAMVGKLLEKFFWETSGEASE